MKKNVASQIVGAQMVSASDGSAFTGSVTCAVTGDGGTQATGSVGSGACTHEGNGYHSYAPSQAETNFDHVAFTFTGTGAIPATVQIYPSFPQTGDSFARIGSPAGASIAADIATVDTVADGIKAVTDNLPDSGALTSLATASALATVDGNVDAILVDTGTTLPATLSTIDSNVDAILVDTGTTLPGTLSTIAGYIDTEIAAIKAVTDNLPDSGALSSLATASDLATVDTVVDAIKAVTDNLPDSGALTSLATASALATVDSNVDAILDDTGTSGVVVASGSKSGYSLAADQSGVTVGTVNALGTQAKADVNAEADTAISDAALATAENLATVDAVADAIKAKTDSLTFTQAGYVDANVQRVNDVLIDGTGAEGDEWGPAS